MPSLPSRFAEVILTFAPLFLQQRTWDHAGMPLIGAILAPGQRTVCGTWEPVASMPRETSKGQTPEEPSTDARRRGGRVRSVCLAAGVSGGLKSHSVRGPGPISEGGGNASPARVDGRYGGAREARRRKPGHG